MPDGDLYFHDPTDFEVPRLLAEVQRRGATIGGSARDSFGAKPPESAIGRAAFSKRRTPWPRVRRRAIAKSASRRPKKPSRQWPPHPSCRRPRRRNNDYRISKPVAKETVHLVQAFIAGRGAS